MTSLRKLIYKPVTSTFSPSKYMWNLEKPYITSMTQLYALDQHIGIFGHLKRLYDKNLNRNVRKIRKEEFDSHYDIYGLHRRQFLTIPQQEISLEG